MKKFLPVLIILFITALFVGGLFAIKREKPVELIKEGGEKVKILLVVAPKNFRDEEFLQPKQIFERNGAEVTVASKGVSEASGMFGAKTKVDVDISHVDISDFDALVFIGGTGASVYFDDQIALSLAKTAFEKGKIVGAICIAPSILANAGILSGKKATAFSSEGENLASKGAQYTDELVMVDGKIVTGRGPEAATEFGQTLVKVLGE